MKERLKGGFNLINLSSMVIEETESAVNISDEEVLKQLFDLNEYAFNENKTLKSVYVVGIDENDVEFANVGEIERNNGVLRILVRVNEHILTIVVTYDVDSDTGERFIDVAQYDYIKESDLTIKSIEDVEELNLNGNLHIAGSLIVDEYVLDTPISINDLPHGFSCNYAHARVSNGKLNIIVSLLHDGTTSVSVDDLIYENISIAIPASVGSKLVAFSGTVVTRQIISMAGSSTTALASREVFVSVNKLSNTHISLFARYKGSDNLGLLGEQTQTRFEFNFLL